MSINITEVCQVYNQPGSSVKVKHVFQLDVDATSLEQWVYLNASSVSNAEYIKCVYNEYNKSWQIQGQGEPVIWIYYLTSDYGTVAPEFLNFNIVRA